jgi:hypothetical protein
MDELVTNEQSFNQEFYEFLRDHLLKRPAMWVGREEFDLVAAFINGMVSAYSNTGRVAKLQDWDFQKYIQKRYGIGRNSVWMTAYIFPGDWTERQKLDRLLEDFADFANPLTRMVIGLDE